MQSLPLNCAVQVAEFLDPLEIRRRLARISRRWRQICASHGVALHIATRFFHFTQQAVAPTEPASAANFTLPTDSSDSGSTLTRTILDNDADICDANPMLAATLATYVHRLRSFCLESGVVVPPWLLRQQRRQQREDQDEDNDEDGAGAADEDDEPKSKEVFTDPLSSAQIRQLFDSAANDPQERQRQRELWTQRFPMPLRLLFRLCNGTAGFAALSPFGAVKCYDTIDGIVLLPLHEVLAAHASLPGDGELRALMCQIGMFGRYMLCCRLRDGNKQNGEDDGDDEDDDEGADVSPAAAAGRGGGGGGGGSDVAMQLARIRRIPEGELFLFRGPSVVPVAKSIVALFASLVGGDGGGGGGGGDDDTTRMSLLSSRVADWPVGPPRLDGGGGHTLLTTLSRFAPFSPSSSSSSSSSSSGCSRARTPTPIGDIVVEMSAALLPSRTMVLVGAHRHRTTYFFAYRCRMWCERTSGDDVVGGGATLQSRRWRIYNTRAEKRNNTPSDEVEGEGVVGLFPTLLPLSPALAASASARDRCCVWGDDAPIDGVFEYASGTTAAAPRGASMEGEFVFRLDGRNDDIVVTVPNFRCEMPPPDGGGDDGDDEDEDSVRYIY